MGIVQLVAHKAGKLFTNYFGGTGIALGCPVFNSGYWQLRLTCIITINLLFTLNIILFCGMFL